MNSEKYVGTVVWFSNKLNFGFISRPQEKDIFVYWSDIMTEGYKTLKKGQKVAFSVGLNHKNQPKAIDVVVIEDVPSQEE